MGRSGITATIGALVCALLLAGVTAPSAEAYTPTVGSNGVSVRWFGEAKINLAGHPSNRSGLDAGRLHAAVARSLQRWKHSSGGSVGFDYWQGTDSSVYVPDSEYNGLSSFYFLSNARVDPSLSPNVLGLTQVWYNTDSGEILETDIVLNDRDFRFTTDPRDTSGYGSAAGSNYSGGRSNVYIENVLTHELGHAFGLSHSGGLQSTMLFMESPEQAHLGCDEAVGIRAVYPSGDAGTRGRIQGQVVSEAGRAVFGAHVVAISRRRGTALASSMTDKNGNYSIGALEAGTYFLMVEPFFAGSSALPAYYNGATSSICPGNHSFGRSMLMESGTLRPQPMQVGSGGTTGAPQLVARCGNYGGAALSANTGSANAQTAPVIYSGSENGFGVVDKFQNSNTVYYRLQALAGRVEIHALSYSLYSPVRPTLSLRDMNGGLVPSAQVTHPTYSGDSGYVNFDSTLTAENLPAGDYYLQVSSASMDATRYPAGPISLDSVPFLVITGSVNEGSPALASALAVNARCRMSEDFGTYNSPGGNPPRRSLNEDDDGVGFCGTISTASGTGGGGSGPSTGALIGWFLPWLAMAAMARAAKRLRPLPGSGPALA